ncbi:MAG: LCP family protein [Candidatus Faecivicinus sp.]
MKKAISMLLVLLLLFSAAAFAEGTEEEWWNILLMGGDSRSLTGYERTDSMIILSLNRDSGEMKMTSIMRDTWVKYPDRNQSNRINAANVFGGPELSMATVNSCFGTDIEDYVLINMTGLIKIIDLVGGVDMEISESERKYANQYARSYLSATASYDGETSLSSSGLVHMNGLLAMSYARNRYTDSDYGRVMRQQKLLMALAEKAQDTEVDELMNMAGEVSDYMQTNMTNDELREVATAALVIETQDVGQFRIPVDGTFDSGILNGMWTIRPDFEKNTELLHEFIYGE